MDSRAVKMCTSKSTKKAHGTFRKSMRMSQRCTTFDNPKLFKSTPSVLFFVVGCPLSFLWHVRYDFSFYFFDYDTSDWFHNFVERYFPACLSIAPLFFCVAVSPISFRSTKINGSRFFSTTHTHTHTASVAVTVTNMFLFSSIKSWTLPSCLVFVFQLFYFHEANTYLTYISHIIIAWYKASIFYWINGFRCYIVNIYIWIAAFYRNFTL